jgi:hypothetical protein
MAKKAIQSWGRGETLPVPARSCRVDIPEGRRAALAGGAASSWVLGAAGGGVNGLGGAAGCAAPGGVWPKRDAELPRAATRRAAPSARRRGSPDRMRLTGSERFMQPDLTIARPARRSCPRRQTFPSKVP